MHKQKDGNTHLPWETAGKAGHDQTGGKPPPTPPLGPATFPGRGPALRRQVADLLWAELCDGKGEGWCLRNKVGKA